MLDRSPEIWKTFRGIYAARTAPSNHLEDKMSDSSPAPSDPLLNVKIVYGLYAVGYFVGLTSIVGVIYAYISRGKSDVADTHLTFQIRTFWISLAVAIVGLLTTIVVVGFFILIGLFVWGLVRIISGFVLANDGKPVSGTKFMGALAQ
ncbi:MAG: hypothetical protein AAFX00_00575 [Pseudomonadota bacterium]